MNNIITSFLYNIIKCIYNPVKKITFCFLNMFIRVPKIHNSRETIEYIIDNKCSVSRYGDGELCLCFSQSGIGFQKYDKALSDNLIRVLYTQNKDANHISCIPYTYRSCAHLTEAASKFWRLVTLYTKWSFIKRLPKREYYDSLSTRPYMDLADKGESQVLFDLWKKVWEEKDIIIVEGELSRLGEGNDLFKNARSLKRIIAPSKNAFFIYDKILSEVKNVSSKTDLILIALGPTATVLAYDLACVGYWAIDIGHIDVEYMWYQSSATCKHALPGRHINEINFEDDSYQCSKEYLSSIISKL